MADKRDVAELLKFELKFLEDGGYGRSPHMPRLQPTIFLDSPTCLNFGDPARRHPCSECFLMEFVPAERRSEAVPCHHIPLNREGETLDSLYRSGSQDDIEDSLAEWIRRTISGLECGDASDANNKTGT